MAQFFIPLVSPLTKKSSYTEKTEFQLVVESFFILSLFLRSVFYYLFYVSKIYLRNFLRLTKPISGVFIQAGTRELFSLRKPAQRLGMCSVKIKLL